MASLRCPIDAFIPVNANPSDSLHPARQTSAPARRLITINVRRSSLASQLTEVRVRWINAPAAPSDPRRRSRCIARDRGQWWFAVPDPLRCLRGSCPSWPGRRGDGACGALRVFRRIAGGIQIFGPASRRVRGRACNGRVDRGARDIAGLHRSRAGGRCRYLPPLAHQHASPGGRPPPLTCR